MAYTRDHVRPDMRVYSSDGARLGKVSNHDDNGFIVEKGVFFPKDYQFSYSEIADIKDDSIHLNMDERSFREGRPAPTEQKHEEQRTNGAARGTHEEVRIPLAEEHLEASKRTEESGRVRVTKEVVTEEETVRVPVTREQVRVERVPAEGAGKEPAPGTFEEETVEVPVYEEHAEVTKRPEVREEVRVSKEHYREEEKRKAPVRKEHAVVEEETTEPEVRASEREKREGYKAPPPRHDDR